MTYKEWWYNIINLALEHDLSDILISPQLPPFMRVNGVLVPINKEKISNKYIDQVIGITMTEKQKTLFEKNLELDYAYSFNAETRFRVNAFCTIHGRSIAMRRINSQLPDINNIHLPNEIFDLVKQKQGLILVVGPTGSGKSTSLTIIIEHIITIEDPVEFIFHSKKSIFNQREVGNNTHSFSNALRSTLREDPDLIMLGEMRDPETAKLALSAAETGHLVLSTLHTNNAYHSITRIIDMFPDADKQLVISLLAESLIAVVSQRLLPLKDKSGRVAAYELLIATPAIKNLINSNKISQIYSMMQVGSKYGMITLEDSVKKLFDQDLITQETLDQYVTKVDSN